MVTPMEDTKVSHSTPKGIKSAFELRLFRSNYKQYGAGDWTGYENGTYDYRGRNHEVGFCEFTP